MDEEEQGKKPGRDKRMRALTAKFNSAKELEDYCFRVHEPYLRSRHFRKWINEKGIGISNFSNLGKNEVRFIRLGIKDAIRAAKLHFKIYDNDSHAAKKAAGLADKAIKGSELLRMAIEKRICDKKEHADIFIFNSHIKSGNTTIRDGEALTYVPEGVMAFSFDPFTRYPRSFLRRRAKHEGLHLLGLNAHHEDTEVSGYSQGKPCVMRYNAPTSRLCRKCKDALECFWEGIEHATKR